LEVVECSWRRDGIFLAAIDVRRSAQEVANRTGGSAPVGSAGASRSLGATGFDDWGDGHRHSQLNTAEFYAAVREFMKKTRHEGDRAVDATGR